VGKLRRFGITGRDVWGLAVVLINVVAMLAFRAVYVEPMTPPGGLAGLARFGLLWLQAQYLWGAMALVLGLVAFFGRFVWVSVAAVLVGADAVINYNATWGMVGAVLGAWAWGVMRE
jgi:hypothetical protein